MARKRRRGSNTGIPGLSFSWKRAFGITKLKRRIARKTHIPTSRAGRQRKAGSMMGCLIPILLCALTVFFTIWLVFILIGG